MATTSKFNEILNQIDNLSYADQEMLIDIVKKRLIENRRDEIADNIKQAHQEYKSGNVVRGSVEDIINELNN
ncbi:MAG: hypothetical protein QNJ55_25460 [Xenococcus sp. MO_188.B8]|nr:hypothetical protein [Xenococcus sp. MO_188.B8]